MSDPKPTIIYWKVASRGQLPLLLLSAGNIEYNYDDATANEWPGKKQEMPFGQLPVLKTADGTLIGQSGAIARYCAKLAGLFPTNVTEIAVVDSIMEQCNDVFNGMVKAKYTPVSNENKGEAWKAFQTETLPKLDWINALLEKIDTAFFGGDAPNAADISIFSTMNLVEKAGIALPTWSRLTPLYEKVATVGKIPEYLAANYPPYFEAK